MMLTLRKTYYVLRNSEFFKNSFILISGTSFSILVAVLASPILTRIYSPTEFGIFALFSSIVTFLGVIIAAKYELAIILPKDDEDSIALMVISMIFSIIFSLLILGIIVAIIRMRFVENCNWLYFVPLVCLCVGLFQSSYYQLVRQRRFNAIAIAKSIQALLTIVFSIVFAFMLDRSWGLILGYVIGQGVSSLFLLGKVVKFIRHYEHCINLINLCRVIKRYKNFPLYLIVSRFTEEFSAQVPTFFLTAFFGKYTVGFYSLAHRVVRAPTILISAAIGDVFRQKASFEYANKGECKDIFKKVFLLLSTLSIIPFVIFFFIAPNLFAFIFGPEWREAGEYASILTVMLFLQFIVNPLSNMFMIAEKQKIDFIMQIYLVTGNILSLWCGYYFFNSVKSSLILLTSVYSAKYLFELIMSYKFSLGINNQQQLDT